MSDAREALARVIAAVDKGHDPGSGDLASPEEYADAVLAFLTSDEAVERAGESLHPGVFSLTDHLYAIHFDNSKEDRGFHQAQVRLEARVAILAAVGGGVVNQRVASEVEIVPNPQARPPWIVASEVDGGFAPQLGSPEIIKIAEYAAAEGFRVLRFQLVDRRHDLIAQPEQDELSEQLVDAFQERGHYGLQLLLRRDYPNLFLNGVELYQHPGTRIEIRRRGVLLTNDEEQR